MTGEAQTVGGVPLEILKEHQIRTTANAAAMAEPLPGPVRDAVSGRSPIKVGKYQVRACKDCDIEYLSLLNHPMNGLRLEMAARPDAKFEDLWADFEKQHNYRGPMAWQICYLLTHDPDDVDQVFEREGIEGIKNAARKEFSRLSPSAVVELTPACLIQYMRSWTPVLSYEPAATDDDDAPLKKNPVGSVTDSGS